MSTEELATSVYGAFPRYLQNHCNREPNAPKPEDYLREVLAPLSPFQAALVGFRLCQAMRDTRAGNLEAPAAHALRSLCP